MDGEIALYVVLLLGLIGIPSCTVMVSDYQEQQVRMECLRQHGDWQAHSCIFRQAK